MPTKLPISVALCAWLLLGLSQTEAAPHVSRRSGRRVTAAEDLLSGDECSRARGPCVPARSLCSTSASNLSSLQKVAVVAGTRHLIDWLRQVPLDHIIVYQHENASKPHYFTNYANEANAYIQFIYDYYDCLPKAVALLHGHKKSWHSSDMQETLSGLRWDLVPGYASLNRKAGFGRWTKPLGNLKPVPDKPPLASGKDAYNGSFVRGQVIGGIAYDAWAASVWHQRQAARQLYDELLGPAGLGGMPDTVTFFCCTQMVVTSDQIRVRSREFYKSILLYLQDNSIRSNHQSSKVVVAGDAIAVMWSLILDLRWERLRKDCELFDVADCRPAGAASPTGRT